MSLSELQTEIAKHEDYKDLDQTDWEAKIEYRDITKRSQKDFDYLKVMYDRKITELRHRLAGDWDFSCKISTDGKKLNSDADILDAMNTEMDEWYYCNAKEVRLLDKLAVVLKEEQLRKDGLVVRTGLHDQTDYYIDYDNGNDGSAGTATGTAWKTITKYTTDTIRTPGDRAFLRANITWDQGTEAVDITFDEDATFDLAIELIGCDSVTNDPWGDASDVKPIIDFEDASYRIYISGLDYWRFERLDIRQSGDTSGMVGQNNCDYIYWKDCNFQDIYSSAVEGVVVTTSEFTTFDGCTFEDMYIYALQISYGGRVFMKDCTITAGADVGTDYGIWLDNSATLWMQDITFSGSFDQLDLRAAQNSTVHVRNVNWSGSGVSLLESSTMLSEDDNATHKDILDNQSDVTGTITRGTASPRSGGATSYAIMTPGTSCGLNRPLVLGDRLYGFRRIWKAAGSYTVTVYVRVGAAWAGALTAAQCYLRTSEFDTAPARTERQSTETITNDGNWTALTTSISPSDDGYVYFWVELKHREDAADVVHVDILPLVA